MLLDSIFLGYLFPSFHFKPVFVLASELCFF
jgi:hypothetical protein